MGKKCLSLAIALTKKTPIIKDITTMTKILPQLPCKRKATLRMGKITLVSCLPQPLLYALQSSLHQTKIWQFPQVKVVSHASFLITCIPEKINTTINYKIDISSSTKKPEYNLGNRFFRTQRAPNVKCSSFDLHCWKVNKIVNGRGTSNLKHMKCNLAL